MRNNAYIVNPYPNEHSLRLRDPGDFAPGTFRRTEGSGKAKVQGVRIPKSVSVIWGKLKGKAGKDDPPVAQALRFPVKYWGRDPAKAKAWIKKHALKGRFEKAASKTKENMAAMETTFKLYSLINRAYKARQEIWMDRPHLAVPVVMLVEGVHNRILYPAEELATFPEAWNGIPVSLNHPKDPHGEPISCNDPQVHERQYLGRVWNVEYDQEAARLKGEVWFDIEHLREHAPELLNMVLNGEPVEVSTGLWGEEELVQGEWNGEEYFSILRAYRPDHLAVLPGAEGACNW
ncbi:MAG: hypothetical protein JRI84_15235, partial [Deltaproteobacteria bacterium]|nr:hypothetical protein [Deltaproteobacteria bacterium]